MAKANQKPAAPESETAVTIAQSGGALQTYDYGSMAGEGWGELDQDDFQIPRIKQLQSLSPEVEEGGDEQVEGARPGMFINSVTKEVTKSLNFVIVRREHVFVEWIPQDAGGGFVGVHAKGDPVVVEAKANAVDRNLKTAEGNDLIDTQELYIGILDEAGEEIVDFAIMGLTSTKQAPYRRLMTRNRRVKGSNRIPLAAFPVTMNSVKAKNKAGQPYFNVEFDVLGGQRTEDSILAPDSPILAAASEFLASLDNGDRQVKYDEPKATTASDDTDEVF